MKKKVIFAMLVLMVSLAGAMDEKILIRALEENNSLSIIGIEVISNNSYYSGYYGEIFSEETNYRLELANKSNKTILAMPMDTVSFALIDYSNETQNTETISLFSGEFLLETRKINFCNNNSICEPCLDGNCTNYENEITCADCEQSSEDGYCNVNNDDVCDRDCVFGYSYDELSITEGCYEDVLLDSVPEIVSDEDTCIKAYGDWCRSGEYCKGGDAIITETGEMCCLNGNCAVEIPFEERYENVTLEQKETKDETDYFWLILAGVLILLLLIIIYIKNKKIVTISLFAVFLLSFVFLYNYNERTPTAYAVNEITSESQAMSVLPELFMFNNAQVNHNLYVAITSISAEFRRYNVAITPELLAAMYTTMEKEVGGYGFLPVEEYGDYCMGPGCTYKVGGRCRSSPYYGGCDYKGRGYIQLTHNSGYAKFCGSDCLSKTANECNCNGKAYCSNQNCPPAKAMTPEIASRAFAQFYLYKNLVNLANKKDFWTVGYYINGGESYANDFRAKANSKLALFKRNEKGLAMFLNFLNKGKIDTNPEEPDDTEEDTEENSESWKTASEEISRGDAGGYYYLNPSFRINGFDVNTFDNLVDDAKKLVEDCKTGSCTMPKCWTAKCTGSMCNIDVETFYNNYYYDEKKKDYIEESNLKIKFALELEATPKEQECLPPEEIRQPTDFGEKPDLAECNDRSTYIEGIDVSHWNSYIDWKKVKASGKEFAFIKATEGTGFKDDKFDYNIQEANAAGVLAGAYHFARPDLPNGAANEAKYFASVINAKKDAWTLPPVLDLEVQGSDDLSQWVVDFMETVKKETGVTPIIYTNPSFLNQLDSRVNNYPLWVAQWGVSTPSISQEWDFWQYTDSGSGRPIGISSDKLDLNKYRGSVACLKAKFMVSP